MSGKDGAENYYRPNQSESQCWQTEKTENKSCLQKLNYLGHGISKKNVQMINSYYRISDGERGDRK